MTLYAGRPVEVTHPRIQCAACDAPATCRQFVIRFRDSGGVRNTWTLLPNGWAHDNPPWADKQYLCPQCVVALNAIETFDLAKGLDIIKGEKT